jgi:hypothetical protein
VRRRCEKSGWDNLLVLFYLVNIPTIGAESSQKPERGAVKKWDKKAVGTMIEAGLPDCAVWRDRFSKTGTWLKCLFMRSMGRISTFQARTVTATSIFIFFSCFLEAVAPPVGN